MTKTMRKIMTILMTMVIVISNFQFISYSYGLETKSEDGYTYVINNSQVTITSYDGEDEEVEIPSEINGYKVTTIGESAFKRNENIKKITLPSTIKTLQAYSFASCFNLEEIILNEGLEKIDRSAFSYCEKMTSIQLPESLEYIGYYAFADCKGLEEITIPSKVKAILLKTFIDCENLKVANLPEGLNKIEEYAFSDCISLNKINLPEGLSEIGKNTFQYTDSLEKIIIPGSVKKIPSSLFYRSKGIKEVIINEGVEEIDALGFYEASNLETVSLPTTMVSIGTSAFNLNKKLKNINLPENLKTLGAYAFYDCESLSSINIPNNLRIIEESTFEECENLSKVDMGNNIESIKDDAFRNCIKLTNVEFPETLKEIGEMSFFRCGSLTSVILPDSLTNLSEGAFMYCWNLEDLKLSSNLQVISRCVFAYCEKLKEINIPTGVEKIENDAFVQGRSVTKLTLPETLVSIGSYAFSQLGNVGDIIIPKSVQEVSSDTFSAAYISGYVYMDKKSPIYEKIAHQFGISRIKFFESDDEINELSLNYIQKNLNINEELQLEATYSPDDREVNLRWSSSDSTVAAVDENGLVITKGIGSTIISAIDEISGLTTTCEINVLPININEVSISNIPTRTYTGQEIKPSLIISDNKGMELVEGTDYTLTYDNNINTGTASVTIKGMGKYNGEKKVNFTISKKSISSSSISISYISTQTYNSKSKYPKVEIKIGDKTLIRDVDYKLTYKDNIKIGKASIVITGMGNYKNEKTVYFTIKPKTISNLKSKLTTSSVQLSWSKDSSVSGYEVYKNDKKIATINKNSTYTYTDKKVSSSTTYSYKVRSYKVVNGKTYYGSYSTIKATTKPLTPKTNLTKLKNNSIKTTWNKINRASGYEVHMATSKGGTYKLIKDEKKGNLYYTKTNLTKGKTYYFKVRAYKIVDNEKIYGSYSSYKYMKL